uniref:Intraflagellar transport protein 56 n=1 Tax=Palpitomonas bilix TaxID=652834 RepID=A0A7S3GFC7_9EUKA|mmetsp:Transcript_47052/g.121564  ORF Transcript_47052/g.121564 Transcript_47052/m.121564 type:complete len:557 (+) Transcript_47052:170-1840(+)|eukprot:CAMPEP_0113902174 /NCGR_PEP_ID=MMETSP0780_2-20120614/21696_1 /TAXON_ID=652834 /ORGANISM="Palpitomonas bilix" /LENGTH=556 /DNA_ID=CAMNT_0000894935 /DNA_START=159 /DNA_END=1829 /DNA_ORIENTATION=- /assembly_acc=CAM_ASM_000599
MIPSRQRVSTQEKTTLKDKNEKKLDLMEFIQSRDYTAAMTLLNFEIKAKPADGKAEDWLIYCAFHGGDYKKALDVLKAKRSRIESSGGELDPTIHLHIACCEFYLSMYKEAEEDAQKGPATSLQTRLLFHVAHKFNDESKLMVYHQKLKESTEDQLCLASIHYLRSHFQEATDIYKRMLLENRDYLALNVYVALCYYKLDYYDVSLEILGVYLQAHPDSAVAINLKACNHFKLYNGKAAETELKSLMEKASAELGEQNDLVRHNLVVFRSGENALQIFPPLLDVIPEARLNLAIYYLRNDEVQDAFNLMKDLEPTTPQEYILKGVVNACIGQKGDSRDHLKTAQQYFQLVGASASECDTIPGRQCMASCFFILKQFDDVLIYLKSIKTYFYNDDDFNWNFGIAKSYVGHWKEAEEALLLVQNEKYRGEYTYIAWLARCHIMNNKPRLAWELYLKMETTGDSFNLLQLIANDCYKMGQFFYSAKAFDVLERLDPNPEYWEGKRGACIGVFQQIIAGKESKDLLKDIVNMLRNTTNPQVEYITRTIKKWAKDNGLKLA